MCRLKNNEPVLFTITILNCTETIKKCNYLTADGQNGKFELQLEKIYKFLSLTCL